MKHPGGDAWARAEATRRAVAAEAITYVGGSNTSSLHPARRSVTAW
jgi:hypothetical protein